MSAFIDMRSFIMHEARLDALNTERSEVSRRIDDAARRFANDWMNRNPTEREDRSMTIETDPVPAQITFTLDVSVSQVDPNHPDFDHAELVVKGGGQMTLKAPKGLLVRGQALTAAFTLAGMDPAYSEGT